MNNKYLKHSLAIVLLLMLSVHLRAISPVLCEPRIGDRLEIDVVSAVRSFADSAGLCPELSEVWASGQQSFGVWAPLSNDTVSFAYLSLGSELSKLTKDGDALKVRFEQRPGNKRTFDSGMPYGMSEYGYSCPLSSYGTVDGLSRFRSAGRVEVSAHPRLFMITFNGDTLHNVECTEYAVTDTLYYESGDTCLHAATHRLWYAPGYRYPLLVCRKDEIRNIENEFLDFSEKWFSCRTDIQEDNITEDTVNEEIRRAIAENRSYHLPIQYNAKNISADNGALPPCMRRDGNSIVVSGSFRDEKINCILLCDVKGRVYTSHVPDENQTQYRIDLSRLVAGEVYILYVQTDGEHYVYRFKA